MATTDVYKCIKTIKALEYLQDMVVTGNQMELLGFAISSQYGELDPNRTINNIFPTWYPLSGQYTAFDTAPSNVGTTLNFTMKIPAGITNSEVYMTEFYIFAKYNNETFLFGILQTQVNPATYRYIPNTTYTQACTYDFTQYEGNLNIIIQNVANFLVKPPLALDSITKEFSLNLANPMSIVDTNKLGITYDETLNVNTSGQLEVDCLELISQDSYNQLGFGSDEKLYTYNPVDTTKITNCILEAPKMIDLELANGTLTLKAGSKVIIPYGTEAPTLTIGDSLNGGTIVDISWDDSKLFYIVQYEEDKTHKYTNATRAQIATINASGSITTVPLDGIYSGSTQPESGWWYDTVNNFVWRIADNTKISLPFAIGQSTKDIGWVTINQVFQSIGYIGNTFWVNKGVKYLIPNGRNKDGTLNNIEAITPYVDVYTQTSPSARTNAATYLTPEGKLTFYNINRAQGNILPFEVDSTLQHIYYLIPKNKYYVTSGSTTANWQEASICEVFRTNMEAGGKISALESNLPFRAVDYNDTDFIAHQAMPSLSKYIDLTFVTNTWYTAPTDGYFTIYAINTTASASKLLALSVENGVSATAPSTGAGTGTFLPVTKGSRVYVENTTGGTVSRLRFYYANGSGSEVD